MNNIKPYKDRLFVKKETINDEIVTSSGIFVIDGKAKREKIDRAVVLAVSDNLSEIYKANDVIIFPKYSVQEQDPEGFYIKHDSILGIIK